MPVGSNQSVDPIDSYAAANRVAWDAIAEKRQKIWPPADFFAQDGSVLDERDRDAAGRLLIRGSGRSVRFPQA